MSRFLYVLLTWPLHPRVRRRFVFEVVPSHVWLGLSLETFLGPVWRFLEGSPYCANFVCSVTRSTTAEFQNNDMMMRANVQNDLRLEMALEMWIVCAHEKSEQL